MESLQLYTRQRNQFQGNVKPLLVVQQTTAQSIPNNAATKITLTTVNIDTHSGFSTGTSTYTVVVAGWYWYSGSITWATNTTGARYTQLSVTGSASTMLISEGSPGGTTPSTLITGPVFLNVGDTVIINGLQNSGAALSTFVNVSYAANFSLEWMRK